MGPQASHFAYQVEVSGWDVDESFFVEKTSLELSEHGERIVSLHHPLRVGLLVFLRLIDSRIRRPAVPVPYRVLSVTPADDLELSNVVLQKLRHPRSKDDKVADSNEGVELL